METVGSNTMVTPSLSSDEAEDISSVSGSLTGNSSSGSSACISITGAGGGVCLYVRFKLNSTSCGWEVVNSCGSSPVVASSSSSFFFRFRKLNAKSLRNQITVRALIYIKKQIAVINRIIHTPGTPTCEINQRLTLYPCIPPR